jgi:uncharacterized membrane protein YfcA
VYGSHLGRPRSKVPCEVCEGGTLYGDPCLFFIAAIVAGAIIALAGGGGLITFPLLALVVPPVTADATSALALLPAYPAAVWRTRGELSGVPRRWLWILLVPSVLGGLVGALLLVWTGDRNFVFMVPWLVLGGTVLFVLEPTWPVVAMAAPIGTAA